MKGSPTGILRNCLCGLLLMSTPVLAQTWTTAQLEVWAVIEAQWEAEAAQDRDWPDRSLHASFVGWDKHQPAPRDQISTKRWNAPELQDGKALMQELYPQRIVVQGDTAVLHYTYTVLAVDHKGDRVTRHGRYTDVLINDGGWKFLAWHGGDDNPPK